MEIGGHYQAINLRKSYGLMILILVMLCQVIVARADTQTDPGINLALAPVYPQNQLVKNNIFDVHVVPRQRQKLTLKVINLANREQTIKVIPRTAYTNDAGNISLDRQRIPVDKTLKQPFSQLVVEKSQRRKLAPGKVQYLTFTVKVPKHHFKGVILGGFYVQVLARKVHNRHKGVTISNRFAYAMPVVLKEQQQTARPKLQLGSIKKPAKLRQKIVVKSILHNPRPAIISGMKIDSTINRKRDGKKVGQTHVKNYEMAPNSNFSFTNHWQNKSILPGIYRLRIDAKAVNGRWHLERDFHITWRDSLGYYNRAHPLVKYILLGLLLLLLLLIIVLVYRRRQREQLGNR